MRLVFRIAGKSSSPTASKSACSSITACGTTAMPHDAMKRFSAMRSCATATLSADGVVKQCSARNARLCAGTFSNSVVTAAHCSARFSSAGASR